ncbi:hydrolase [Pseudovibrio japonicus]|uniref:Hydrolase n=1 Tax=Pseudovibrio japonicus TaxID=366534 RepID=A0ABQ3ENI6_9HYPH|nr:HIT family protein [Pseudovibrio japonicus]GHB48492.1 hydrolase [Pseudovibrio japonicus]
MTSPSYDDQNIFAKILRGELPSEKVYEDENTIVIMDIMPRADGHVLVLPKNGSRNIMDIEEADLTAAIKTTQKMARVLKKAFNADGITIHQFNETAGGQMVFHTHFHVIPRTQGITLRPHTGEMEDSDKLKANANKIRAALEA